MRTSCLPVVAHVVEVGETATLAKPETGKGNVRVFGRQLEGAVVQRRECRSSRGECPPSPCLPGGCHATRAASRMTAPAPAARSSGLMPSSRTLSWTMGVDSSSLAMRTLMPSPAQFCNCPRLFGAPVICIASVDAFILRSSDFSPHVVPR